jgi:hypothetical protein
MPLFTGVRGIEILRTSLFGDSANFAFKEFSEVHIRDPAYPHPNAPEISLSRAPLRPGPLELVTPMDRYTELWMLAYYKLMFVVSREYPMSRPRYLKH